MREQWSSILAAAILLGVITSAGVTNGDEDAKPAKDTKQFDQAATAAGLKIFKTDVRLVLAHKCVGCHGGDDTESEFDLTTRAGLLRGGSEGKAIVPGSAEQSRLVRLIRHMEEPKMPEDAGKLSAAEIASIVAWINHGAPYDKPLIDPAADKTPWTEQTISDDAREYWAFRPLRKSAPPEVKDAAWCQTSYDPFVLARLEKAGLAPNRMADRRDLIRRVYFDLIGMPPTPAQVTAFTSDASPQAYERLVDSLLEHPGYGERWARHWLDVARFAESHGFEHDYDRKTAYHYRDFVIKALNQDMPFDQFVQWQLAGDEMAPKDPLALTATGFLGAGVFPTQITANEVEPTRYDALDDMASTMGTAMLGLTIGCARCHDHKFDPIPSADYYRILSSFTTTVRTEIDLDLGTASKPQRVKAMICSEGLKPMRHHSQGADFFKETYFLSRGDVDQKQGVASQSFLQVLMRSAEKEKHWQVAPPKGARTSYRRTSLARWIVDTRQGAGHLLARVIVNRLWQHHLGRGIVTTPNDFGRQAEPPSHPMLLDSLAAELIAGSWRLKPIHRKILLSAAYMQSAAYDKTKRKIDPENILLWRRRPRRLEAEAIRDTMLAVSGTLDPTMFGPGTLSETSRRRSIYFTVKRSKLIPMMQLFDAPEALVSIGGRGSTTIAPQALLFMNNPQVREYAKTFAGRLIAEYEKSPERAIRRGYMLALGRPPGQDEAADAAAFLQSQLASYQEAGKPMPGQLALADLCQVLMSLNEFIYVE